MDNAPFKGFKNIHLPIKEDIQLPLMRDMSKDCRGWRVSSLNLRHIDTKSTRYSSRRFLWAGCAYHTTHDKASLPASKHQCDAHKWASQCFIGGATSAPKHIVTSGAGRHSMWTLTVLRVLTPLGLEASSWRSCLATQSSISPNAFKLTVTHFLHAVYLQRIFLQFCLLTILWKYKPCEI